MHRTAFCPRATNNAVRLSLTLAEQGKKHKPGKEMEKERDWQEEVK